MGVEGENDDSAGCDELGDCDDNDVRRVCVDCSGCERVVTVMLKKLKSWWKRADPSDVVLCGIMSILAAMVVVAGACGTIVMVAETVIYLGGL
jgi:hypothetical protein